MFLSKLKKYYVLKKFKRNFKNDVKQFKRIDHIYVNKCSITIGEDCIFWRNVSFNCGEIIVGNNCCFGENTIFFANRFDQGGGIRIGNDVMIASNCSFYDSDHGTKLGIPMIKQPPSIDKIVIEDDVWIGAGAIVLKGSHIKKGAIIGAGALVKGEIPENAVAVGIPAKVIKYRE